MMEFINRIEIQKGWSKDKKYQVTTNEGTKYLLRISDKKLYDRKKYEFEMMQRVAALGVPMCKPIEFGICKDGVYVIQSWIEGENAEETINMFADTEQYVYGLEAGRILKKIHSIPAPYEQEDWEIRFNRKIDRKIQNYHECPIKYDNGQAFIDYINSNRHLLKNRPQCYQHGDYHIGNMMIDQEKKLQIIDFDRDDYGDPWEDFNRIVWCAQKSPLFASGMVNGYFEHDVPMDFWRLLALYISSNTLSSIPWAIPFGAEEIETMQNQAMEILRWYDNMKNPVPSWYFKGYYLQYIDGLPYKLKAPYDFQFMNTYGRVFKIYDDQDSGNICFGCEKDGSRYFVKYAGAPTEQYNGSMKDAVDRLKATMPVYQELHHKNLIDLIEARDIGEGFAMVFKWVDGECIGRMYPKTHQKFMNSDLNTRLKIFQDIISFFEYVTEHNYLAIDFYDGSIMYDYAMQKTTICDIDYFRKAPCRNDVGRMFGSSVFMSPEEFELGAVLDEVTNVYTLGATAFALFSNYKRSSDAWMLHEKAFSVAKKAVHNERGKRQQSIKEFITEWENSF